MAKTIFERDALDELNDRLSRLTPDSDRRWGKMTASQMICHLQDALECATGLKPTKPKNVGMNNRVIRWLIIDVLPWPKGKAQTVPEMLQTQPGEWGSDVQRLRDLLEAASKLGPGGNWAPHPAFGEMRGSQYGRLIYRHFNHHFTQFGV